MIKYWDKCQALSLLDNRDIKWMPYLDSAICIFILRKCVFIFKKGEAIQFSFWKRALTSSGKT